MQKSVIFVGIFLSSVLLISPTADAQSVSEIEEFRKSAFPEWNISFTVIVQSEDDRLKSIIVRELRAIQGVTVVEENAEHRATIVHLPTDVGEIISVIVTSHAPAEYYRDMCSILLRLRLESVLSPLTDKDGVRYSRFGFGRDNPMKVELHGVMIDAKISDVAERVVATIDIQVIEPERQQDIALRKILQATKKAP
ncbi:MAG: hypothetical protein DRJ65_19700 [Acidobacteria bacterium]|nr:MAG: hypothetical protein DRJ65_19700 [Acidobacteriota bacterium]